MFVIRTAIMSLSNEMIARALLRLYFLISLQKVNGQLFKGDHDGYATLSHFSKLSSDLSSVLPYPCASPQG